MESLDQPSTFYVPGAVLCTICSLFYLIFHNKLYEALLFLLYNWGSWGSEKLTCPRAYPFPLTTLACWATEALPLECCSYHLFNDKVVPSDPSRSTLIYCVSGSGLQTGVHSHVFIVPCVFFSELRGSSRWHRLCGAWPVLHEWCLVFSICTAGFYFLIFCAYFFSET